VSADAYPPNTLLGDRYRIERLVGKGGLAHVYVASDLRLDRSVAVKVLRREFADSISAERFRREVDVMAKLSHPHLLQIFDRGEANDTFFYVTPHVADGSLRRRLERERRLGEAEAVRIAAEVSSALSYIHGQGVVHRDIKPENILLDAGKAVLADFGIAKAAPGGSSYKPITHSGQLVGTPAYMSPEQAGFGAVDARSDLYSLGCVLCEMLTGELRLNTATMDISANAAAVVHRLLQRDPGERFRSADELLAALS
jgi:serine/threonine-protein kinase